MDVGNKLSLEEHEMVGVKGKGANKLVLGVGDEKY